MPDHSAIRARTIAIVGLMGVGKTTIGRRVAKRLGLPFYDSDHEIEKAAGCSVIEYFNAHGEADFREGERRVIERLVSGEPKILATGGGAFIPEPTRQILLQNTTTIWLKSDLETIMKRVSRKNTRPLLQVPDPRSKMRELMDVRYPIYAQADITVDATRGSHIRTVNRVLRSLKKYDAQKVLS